MVDESVAGVSNEWGHSDAGGFGSHDDFECGYMGAEFAKRFRH